MQIAASLTYKVGQLRSALWVNPGLAPTPVTMLWMLARVQQARDQAARGHPNVLAPVDQPLRVPLQVRPVGFGQMLGQGREFALVGTARMACHTGAAMQHLHDALCDARLQRATNQGVRYAVVVLLERDVGVDMNLYRLVGGQLPGLHWQGPQGRGVDFCKHTGAATGELLKRFGVELFEQRCNELVPEKWTPRSLLL